MYEPYPTSGPAQEPERIRPPRPVVNAVKLMYAGAALEALALIIAVVTIGSLKSAILARHPAYTAAQLHSAELARTVPLAIGALIAIGLWLWMAWANGKGRSWARIVSAVLFGINTLDLLISLLQVHAVTTLIIGVVIWLVGLAAIVLIFGKESGPFYSSQARGNESRLAVLVAAYGGRADEPGSGPGSAKIAVRLRERRDRQPAWKTPWSSPSCCG